MIKKIAKQMRKLGRKLEYRHLPAIFGERKAYALLVGSFGAPNKPERPF